MRAYRHIAVRPLSGAIGAEIGGVGISGGLADAVIDEIRRALLEHLVVFFHDQSIDVEEHKAFTRRFGEIFVHPNFDVGGDNDPEIVMVTRRPGDERVVGGFWHTDTTMMSTPPMGAILYALEVPAHGADTLFANQYLAYERLSEGMRRLLDGLRAVHDDTLVAGPNAGINRQRTARIREDAAWRPTQSVHPVVRTHPETMRRCLFVNPVYTRRFEGMTEQESRPLLEFLHVHATRPEFTCRFAWRSGSVAFWDNRCTQHYAIHDRPDAARRMRRTQIAG